jgi:hypothetical protein
LLDPYALWVRQECSDKSHMVAVVRVVRQLVQQSGQFFSSCSICHTGCLLRFGRFISGTGIKIFPVVCASEKGHSLRRVAPRVGIRTSCRFHPILFYLIVYGSLSVTDQRSVENLAMINLVMINCLFRRMLPSVLSRDGLIHQIADFALETRDRYASARECVVPLETH